MKVNYDSDRQVLVITTKAHKANIAHWKAVARECTQSHDAQIQVWGWAMMEGIIDALRGEEVPE